MSGVSTLATSRTEPLHSLNDVRMIRMVFKRFWFLFIVLILTVITRATTAPVEHYVTLTFFSSFHGGGDCLDAPQSKPCRLAAGDHTIYSSTVDLVTSMVSVVTALTLGSLSDSIGRRAIFIVKGCLSVAVIYALCLYQFLGVSLWLFLLIRPLESMFDFHGAVMATMADVVPERNLRGAVMGQVLVVVLVLGLGTVLACTVLAAVLPTDVVFAVALAAGTCKLIFYFTCFPETSTKVLASDANLRQGPLGAIRAAYRIVTMNSFILRMALITVIGGVSSVGTGIVSRPYLTSYIGMKRQELVMMGVVIILSLFLTLGVLAKPIIRYLGEVRTYQICIFSVSLHAAALCFCSEPWQVIALGVFAGAHFLQLPIISAIKSNLVSDSQQGLVQGVLVSLVNLASGLAAPIFGWTYNINTRGGASRDRSDAFPSLIACACTGMLAFAVSLSLPLRIPEAIPDELDQVLLQDK